MTTRRIKVDLQRKVRRFMIENDVARAAGITEDDTMAEAALKVIAGMKERFPDIPEDDLAEIEELRQMIEEEMKRG